VCVSVRACAHECLLGKHESSGMIVSVVDCFQYAENSMLPLLFVVVITKGSDKLLATNPVLYKNIYFAKGLRS
jgi:hypothetical protein